jgi:hypothetical protein
VGLNQLIQAMVDKSAQGTGSKPTVTTAQPGEVRWNMKQSGAIYIQIQLTVQMNKEYGVSETMPIPPALAKMLYMIQTKGHAGQSLAGTNTPYGKGKVVKVGGKLMVKLDEVGVVLPLSNELTGLIEGKVGL